VTGLHPDPLGELQCSSRLPSCNPGRGPTSKGKGRKESGRNREGKGKGGERKG